jgi:hypothetical protein
MTDPHAEDLSGTPAARGMHDVASGLAVARADFVDFRHSLVDVVRGDFSQVSMGLLALITRAQGFFDGALKGVENDNPYATFPLIRCYAENAAVLLWILDHPNDLSRLSSSAPADERFAIGRLISNAAKRAKGFKAIYEQLSEFSHPVATGFHQPWRVVPDEERTLQWSSVPSFKTTEDKIWACFWLVELTEIHANVWPSAYRASVTSPAIT